MLLPVRFRVRFLVGLATCVLSAWTGGRSLLAEDYVLHTFDRVELTNEYYAEGANFADLNNDGRNDVIYGPYWFEGPDFKVKHEIYEPKPQPKNHWADHFFAWTYDFNGDGLKDILTVGFPGTPSYVYQNPGRSGADKHWPKHEIFKSVQNESPQFVDLNGDDQPELVCTFEGQFIYLTFSENKGLEPWTLHRISGEIAPKSFGHGLGVGDVNGDGKLDVLFCDGWLEQPADLSADQPWTVHNYQFADYGGADMFAYDVDGDGDADVITSLQAHEYGLAWYEQVKKNGEIDFVKHLIVGDKPEDNHYGVLFTEMHSISLNDIDGDGLKDIVTGKTYWSHHKKSPMWDAGAVTYWFKLVRGKNGVNWVPMLADDQAGIGRQLIVGDVDLNQAPDIVTGGMLGCHVLLHNRKAVDQATWQKSQPVVKFPEAGK